jgi:hypothetical protein
MFWPWVSGGNCPADSFPRLLQFFHRRTVIQMFAAVSAFFKGYFLSDIRAALEFPAHIPCYAMDFLAAAPGTAGDLQESGRLHNARFEEIRK